MELKEAKQRFIEAWGTLGTNWGINKTMAQIHALLLVSPRSLTADEIMEELTISRGNTNMNVRALIDWGLVYKEGKLGERKEYFYAEKDMWKIATRVVRERRRRELEPMFNVLTEVVQVKGKDDEAKAFRESVEHIKEFAEMADGSLEKFSKSEESWFLKTFLKIMS